AGDAVADDERDAGVTVESARLVAWLEREVDLEALEAAHCHRFRSGSEQARYRLEPLDEISRRRPDAILGCLRAADRGGPGILGDAEVAAAERSYLRVTGAVEPEVTGQVLHVAPAGRDGVRDRGLEHRGMVGARCQVTQAGTSAGIGAVRPRGG